MIGHMLTLSPLSCMRLGRNGRARRDFDDDDIEDVAGMGWMIDLRR